MKVPKVIRDLHNVREKMYLATKKMSKQEYLEHSLAESRNAIKKLNLKVKELAHK